MAYKPYVVEDSYMIAIYVAKYKTKMTWKFFLSDCVVLNLNFVDDNVLLQNKRLNQNY